MAAAGLALVFAVACSEPHDMPLGISVVMAGSVTISTVDDHDRSKDARYSGMTHDVNVKA
jgi:hypothetical protein